ncbi:major facilitator superfamily domain-containing protein [Aspergillus pseudonomiae]|nr:major facilitator superfamily domain-containing protein [Aspergillus pseudonomiae]
MEENPRPSFDRDTKCTAPSDAVEGQKERGSVDVLGPEEEKRLVRKIDFHLMPLLIISYGLQFLDKTSLSYSAILGLKEDLNLVGQEYSWASSIFYIGYLAASYPISLGFVKFPLGKYLSLLIFLWGVVLTFHALAKDYAGLMVLRTFLGVFESAISPGFSLITGMWYTPSEHVSRHTFWFAGNASFSIIGSLIAYGIAHYRDHFPQWKMLFLIFGLITVAWSVVLWFSLPDSPSNAHFLSSSEREFASLRPKKFQRTTQTKKWNRNQFIESLIDPKTWWLVIFSFVICVPNGGTTSFQSLLIAGFGYDKYQTILMGLPASAFQLVVVLLAAIFCTNVRKSRLIAIIMIFVMALAGILMVKLLPSEQKLSRLAGYWMSSAIAPVFPLMLSLHASNTAGFTKKSTVAALIFVGYCVGNLIGPQFFKNSEAPYYPTAYTTIVICYAIAMASAVVFRVYLGWENRRRDKQQGVYIDPEETRKIDLHTDEALDHADETDIQNRSFRYIV